MILALAHLHNGLLNFPSLWNLQLVPKMAKFEAEKPSRVDPPRDESKQKARSDPAILHISACVQRPARRIVIFPFFDTVPSFKTRRPGH